MTNQKKKEEKHKNTGVEKFVTRLEIELIIWIEKRTLSTTTSFLNPFIKWHFVYYLFHSFLCVCSDFSKAFFVVVAYIVGISKDTVQI